MKKSIGDNLIPKDWSFEKGLELIKKAGYDGVELWLRRTALPLKRMRPIGGASHLSPGAK